MFNDRDLLAGLEPWVRFETPTHEVERVNGLSRLVEEELAGVGLRTERIEGRDGYGDHLIGRTSFADSRPPILLLAHLDTVHPVGTLDANPFRVDGDRAYGPGIYDMKAGARMSLEVARRLIEQPVGRPRNLTLVFTSDEEVGSPTSHDLITRLAGESGYALVVEPARDGGQLVTSRKGVARYIVRFHGRAAHSGGRYFEGRSAVREMAKRVLAWEGYSDAATGVTVNVGIAQGGTAFNTIPEHACAYVDIRLPTRELAAATLTRFEATATDDPDVQMVMEGGLNREPFDPNPATEALFERVRKLAAVQGLALQGQAAGGGSDGNFTAHIIPTLDGLGVDGEGAHTKHEHIRISSLSERTTLLHGLIAELSAEP